MLNALIRFSLAQRGLIVTLALVLLVLGGRKLTQLPVEVLPDLTKPTVTILTEAPGFAPEEVETLVSVPLENALMGVNGVSRLRTVNDISLSLIFVEFDWGTDIYQARQFVQERLTGVTETLPNGVHPYMTSVASLMGEILFIGIMDPTGKTSPRELRTLADWTLARRFQSIPGVAEVLAMGGGVKQLQIQPRPQAMLARGISFNELHDAAAMAVSNTTGGFLTENAQEIMVRNLAMTIDPDTIGQTIVAHKDGLPVCIADIANVAWGTEPMRGDAGMGSKHSKATKGGMAKGYPGVILSVTKSPGFDTIRLTREVENAMHKMAKTLPEGVEMLSIYRQADYIQLAIGNLKEALRDGAIMVSIILFLFLLNLRVTLITLTAIPLSVAMTILVFDGFGLSVNSMTLGGIAVAIGMVVDDAIVDVENVFRRLRENAGLAHPRGRIDVIADASAEVRSSIFYATVLIVLVFVPLLGLSGVEGRLFSPIAIATIISMLASFLVSLTVIPVLGSFLLKPNPGKQHGDAAPVRALKHLFTKTWLMLALTQPFLVIGLTLGLLFLAVDQALQMGGNFLPAFREPSAVVATTTAPGTSLKQTTEIAEVAIDQLLKIPEVETAGYRAGRAERGDHVVPVSTVEFEVDFDDKSGRPREAVLDEIRTTMRGIPGTFSAMSGPLADRIGHMLSGVSAKVAIKIFGTDLDELRRLGTEIAEIARKIPGLEEARIEQQAPIPQLRIEINRERALAYGVTPGELNEQLAALIGGESLAKIHEDQKIHDLVLRLPPEWRNEPEYLRDLYIDSRSGQRIPLHYIADIRQASGPNTILRENTRRRFVVSINPTTSNLNAAVEELQREVAGNVTLPEGYTVSFEGEYQAQQDAKQRIFIMSGIVLFVVIMLLYGYFRSSPLVLLVLTNLPISLVGGILLTRWTLDNISIATLVGFIAVSGISARNTIMLLSHYLHLMKHEGESFTRKMVERGTRERLVPILMTALSAGIALIPLVLAANEPGKEILNPVAIVIVGGLISSTLLGLLVTPALFYSFCKKSAEKAVHRLGGSSQ
ncbi:MAG: efflux RND transporter permease subunit [Opitutae bacterium]|nr:efflux RND transporter permease subunit [Opitutae bacterium]